MNSHRRRQVRPRYGRIAALATSVTVSVVAALAGVGVLGTGSPTDAATARPASYLAPGRTSPSATPSVGSAAGSAGAPVHHLKTRVPAAGSPSFGPTGVTSLPDHSGTGRRIVFSQRLQRVWLVGADHDAVLRTYPVSGSLTHNLQPGTYAVYARSRNAVGVDDSGVMQYFVRFTQGPTGAAIGFHTIPTKNGQRLQTEAQLGSPQSHGCIRQATPDAIALWNFAPDGTKVVVVA